VVIDAMKTSSLRFVVLVASIAPFLVFHPTIARAATKTVMVGPSGIYGGFFFTPSSVTIHTGDSVLWMWSSSGHSSTSGSPGMPTGWGALEFSIRELSCIRSTPLGALFAMILASLWTWHQKRGRFFDIAILLSSTNAIGFSENIGLIRISMALDVLLPAKLLTQSRFNRINNGQSHTA